MANSKLEGLLEAIQIVKEKEKSKNPNYEGRFGKITHFQPEEKSLSLVEELDLENFRLSTHIVDTTLCGTRNNHLAKLVKGVPLKVGDWINFHVMGLRTDTDGIERSYGVGDDLLPFIPPLIGRVRSGYGPFWTGLQTRLA